MQIEHLVPRAQGGASEETNLWLSCAWCNSYKGTRTHGVDPATGQKAPLHNPRTQRWSEHFRWSDDGSEIIGLAATGRATVSALRLNNEYIVPARRLWVLAGWHPPVDECFAGLWMGARDPGPGPAEPRTVKLLGSSTCWNGRLTGHYLLVDGGWTMQ